MPAHAAHVVRAWVVSYLSHPGLEPFHGSAQHRPPRNPQTRGGRHVPPVWTRPRTLAGAALAAPGQGTVEYVALILLVALVMAGVVAAMKGFRTGSGKELGEAIVGKIKEAVKKVQF